MDVAAMNQFLALGVQHGASDIHFRCGDPPTYRVNGVLRSLQTERLMPPHTRQICSNLISDATVLKQIDTLQEFDTSYAVPGAARFRVNIYRQSGSLSAILRIIPDKVPSIDGLGLPAVMKTIAGFERGWSCPCKNEQVGD